MKLWKKLVVFISIFISVIIGLSSLLGLNHAFRIPTGAMSPAVSPGDHIMMNGYILLFRKPRRGDIIVHRTEHIGMLPPGQYYCKRVVGEPGDVLRISGGDLYVNNQSISLSNAQGRITYVYLQGQEYLNSSNDTYTVPARHYFVLGDNSQNSFDSRSYGAVPGENIQGLASFCYWPPSRAGFIK